jgi:hypothetical protein
MTKANWGKTALIFSLVLNFALITGFGFYKHYVRKTLFQLAALNAQAEVKNLEIIISELNSNDAIKTENLKERLQKQIENAKKVAAAWEDASEGRCRKPQK